MAGRPSTFAMTPPTTAHTPSWREVAHRYRPEITATPRYADAMPTKFRLWFPLAEVRMAKNAWFI